MSCRTLLRSILARYLGEQPAALRFGCSVRGKPELIQTSGADAIRFNVTHSGDLGLFAVSSGRDVGVDAERIRDDLPVAQLKRRFFSPAERAACERMDDERGAFFALWTCREAFLKATGAGLSASTGSVEVVLPADGRPVLRSVAGDDREAARWSLRQLAPASGYAGALVVQGNGWRLRCWDCPPDGFALKLGCRT